MTTTTLGMRSMSGEGEPGVELERSEVQPALYASLSVVAADEPLPQAALDALGWLMLVWSEGHDHVPLFLIHDLGQLLLRGRDLRFSSTRHVSTWEDNERAVRLAYEDRVVARWVIDPSAMEAHVAVSGMPAQLRPRAVAHAVSLALAPLLLPLDLPRGNPAHVRPLLEGVDFRQGLTSIEQIRARAGDVWRAVTLDVVERCLPLLGARRLFGEAELWDIAHLPDVPSESARRALREVHGQSALVGPAAPGALSSLRRAREVPLDADQADTYPTGGFDAVSTKGAFENLVRSEVAYVGAGVDDDRPADSTERLVDLFDVRFAENELLYYTRDESPLLEDRRVVSLVVDNAAELRHKLPELPAQTLVMVLGLCVRMQADLVNGLGPLGSVVTIALCGDAGDAEVLKEELSLLGLSLRSEIAHRRARLLEALNPLEVEGRRVIVFSQRDRPAVGEQQLQQLSAWVKVGGRTWTAWIDGEQRKVDASSSYELRALLDELLLLC